VIYRLYELPHIEIVMPAPVVIEAVLDRKRLDAVIGSPLGQHGGPRVAAPIPTRTLARLRRDARLT
jgi:hypothetical protein